MKEWRTLAALVAVFLFAYLLPLGSPKVQHATIEGFKLLQWYARNHTLGCVVPALFIAGAIMTFLSRESIMRYLGPRSNKVAAYGVASVSGTILAVCSCSVLPMFAGIYRLGAGLGPASAFLYSGPAINILAIFLTARVLGFEIGLWRAVGAMVFALVVGLAMAFFFENQQAEPEAPTAFPQGENPPPGRPLWKTALYFLCMVLFLVFSDWYNPGDVVVVRTDGTELAGVLLQETRDEIVLQLERGAAGEKVAERLVLGKSDVAAIEEADTWVIRTYHVRWYLAGLMGLAVALMAWGWFSREELRQWMENTWDFAKLLVPLLFGGVLAVGFIGTLLPEKQVAMLVGSDSLFSNFVASFVGALFYFATLTEIPIVEALMKLGMSRGPALALLLAGPALSLPNLLVLAKVMGVKRTAVFAGLVVVMATVTGLIYGRIS